MKSRWSEDIIACNNTDCRRAAEFCRYQMLVRLGEDQDKGVEVPGRITFIHPDAASCEMFIEDEYEEET